MSFVQGLNSVLVVVDGIIIISCLYRYISLYRFQKRLLSTITNHDVRGLCEILHRVCAHDITDDPSQSISLVGIHSLIPYGIFRNHIKLTITDFFNSVRYGDEEIVSLFLHHYPPFNIDAFEHYGPSQPWSALFVAAWYQNKRTLPVLLQWGANTEQRWQENGSTALHYAAHVGNQFGVACLIFNGANPGSITFDGHTPAAVAEANRQGGIAGTLMHAVMERNASLEAKRELKRAQDARQRALIKEKRKRDTAIAMKEGIKILSQKMTQKKLEFESCSDFSFNILSISLLSKTRENSTRFVFKNIIRQHSKGNVQQSQIDQKSFELSLKSHFADLFLFSVCFSPEVLINREKHYPSLAKLVSDKKLKWESEDYKVVDEFVAGLIKMEKKSLIVDDNFSEILQLLVQVQIHLLFKEPQAKIATVESVFALIEICLNIGNYYRIELQHIALPGYADDDAFRDINIIEAVKMCYFKYSASKKQTFTVSSSFFEALSFQSRDPIQLFSDVMLSKNSMDQENFIEFAKKSFQACLFNTMAGFLNNMDGASNEAQVSLTVAATSSSSSEKPFTKPLLVRASSDQSLADRDFFLRRMTRVVLIQKLVRRWLTKMRKSKKRKANEALVIENIGDKISKIHKIENKDDIEPLWKDLKSIPYSRPASHSIPNDGYDGFDVKYEKDFSYLSKSLEGFVKYLLEMYSQGKSDESIQRLDTLSDLYQYIILSLISLKVMGGNALKKGEYSVIKYSEILSNRFMLMATQVLNELLRPEYFNHSNGFHSQIYLIEKTLNTTKILKNYGGDLEYAAVCDTILPSITILIDSGVPVTQIGFSVCCDLAFVEPPNINAIIEKDFLNKDIILHESSDFDSESYFKTELKFINEITTQPKPVGIASQLFQSARDYFSKLQIIRVPKENEGLFDLVVCHTAAVLFHFVGIQQFIDLSQTELPKETSDKLVRTNPTMKAIWNIAFGVRRTIIQAYQKGLMQYCSEPNCKEKVQSDGADQWRCALGHINSTSRAVHEINYTQLCESVIERCKILLELHPKQNNANEHMLDKILNYVKKFAESGVHYLTFPYVEKGNKEYQAQSLSNQLPNSYLRQYLLEKNTISSHRINGFKGINQILKDITNQSHHSKIDANESLQFMLEKLITQSASSKKSHDSLLNLHSPISFTSPSSSINILHDVAAKLNDTIYSLFDNPKSSRDVRKLCVRYLTLQEFDGQYLKVISSHLAHFVRVIAANRAEDSDMEEVHWLFILSICLQISKDLHRMPQGERIDIVNLIVAELIESHFSSHESRCYRYLCLLSGVLSIMEIETRNNLLKNESLLNTLLRLVVEGISSRISHLAVRICSFSDILSLNTDCATEDWIGFLFQCAGEWALCPPSPYPYQACLVNASLISSLLRHLLYKNVPVWSHLVETKMQNILSEYRASEMYGSTLEFSIREGRNLKSLNIDDSTISTLFSAWAMISIFDVHSHSVLTPGVSLVSVKVPIEKQDSTLQNEIQYMEEIKYGLFLGWVNKIDNHDVSTKSENNNWESDNRWAQILFPIDSKQTDSSPLLLVPESCIAVIDAPHGLKQSEITYQENDGFTNGYLSLFTLKDFLFDRCSLFAINIVEVFMQNQRKEPDHTESKAIIDVLDSVKEPSVFPKVDIESIGSRPAPLARSRSDGSARTGDFPGNLRGKSHELILNVGFVLDQFKISAMRILYQWSKINPQQLQAITSSRFGFWESLVNISSTPLSYSLPQDFGKEKNLQNINSFISDIQKCLYDMDRKSLSFRKMSDINAEDLSMDGAKRSVKINEVESNISSRAKLLTKQRSLFRNDNLSKAVTSSSSTSSSLGAEGNHLDPRIADKIILSDEILSNAKAKASADAIVAARKSPIDIISFGASMQILGDNEIIQALKSGRDEYVKFCFQDSSNYLTSLSDEMDYIMRFIPNEIKKHIKKDKDKRTSIRKIHQDIKNQINFMEGSPSLLGIGSKQNEKANVSYQIIPGMIVQIKFKREDSRYTHAEIMKLVKAESSMQLLLCNNECNEIENKPFSTDDIEIITPLGSLSDEYKYVFHTHDSSMFGVSEAISFYRRELHLYSYLLGVLISREICVNGFLYQISTSNLNYFLERKVNSKPEKIQGVEKSEIDENIVIVNADDANAPTREDERQSSLSDIEKKQVPIKNDLKESKSIESSSSINSVSMMLPFGSINSSMTTKILDILKLRTKDIEMGNDQEKKILSYLLHDPSMSKTTGKSIIEDTLIYLAKNYGIVHNSMFRVERMDLVEFIQRVRARNPETDIHVMKMVHIDHASMMLLEFDERSHDLPFAASSITISYDKEGKDIIEPLPVYGTHLNPILVYGSTCYIHYKTHFATCVEPDSSEIIDEQKIGELNEQLWGMAIRPRIIGPQIYEKTQKNLDGEVHVLDLPVIGLEYLDILYENSHEIVMNQDDDIVKTLICALVSYVMISDVPYREQTCHTVLSLLREIYDNGTLEGKQQGEESLFTSKYKDFLEEQSNRLHVALMLQIETVLSYAYFEISKDLSAMLELSLYWHHRLIKLRWNAALNSSTLITPRSKLSECSIRDFCEGKKMKQVVECQTCNKKNICTSCFIVCHANHKVGNMGVSNAHCSCSSDHFINNAQCCKTLSGSIVNLWEREIPVNEGNMFDKMLFSFDLMERVINGEKLPTTFCLGAQFQGSDFTLLKLCLFEFAANIRPGVLHPEWDSHYRPRWKAALDTTNQYYSICDLSFALQLLELAIHPQAFLSWWKDKKNHQKWKARARTNDSSTLAQCLLQLCYGLLPSSFGRDWEAGKAAWEKCVQTVFAVPNDDIFESRDYQKMYSTNFKFSKLCTRVYLDDMPKDQTFYSCKTCRMDICEVCANAYHSSHSLSNPIFTTGFCDQVHEETDEIIKAKKAAQNDFANDSLEIFSRALASSEWFSKKISPEQRIEQIAYENEYFSAHNINRSALLNIPKTYFEPSQISLDVFSLLLEILDIHQNDSVLILGCDGQDNGFLLALASYVCGIRTSMYLNLDESSFLEGDKLDFKSYQPHCHGIASTAQGAIDIKNRISNARACGIKNIPDISLYLEKSNRDSIDNFAVIHEDIFSSPDGKFFTPLKTYDRIFYNGIVKSFDEIMKYSGLLAKGGTLIAPLSSSGSGALVKYAAKLSRGKGAGAIKNHIIEAKSPDPKKPDPKLAPHRYICTKWPAIARYDAKQLENTEDLNKQNQKNRILMDENLTGIAPWSLKKWSALASYCDSLPYTNYELPTFRDVTDDVFDRYPILMDDSKETSIAEIRARFAIRKRVSAFLCRVLSLGNLFLNNKKSYMVQRLLKLKSMMTFHEKKYLMHTVMKGSYKSRMHGLHQSVTISRKLAQKAKENHKPEDSSFLQAFYQLDIFDEEALRSGEQSFKIRFAGEGGQDVGGLYSEFLSMVAEELKGGVCDMFTPSYLSEAHDTTLIPNAKLASQYNENQYQFFGMLIGLCIMQPKTQIPIDLNPIMFKILVGERLTDEDVKLIDTGSFKRIMYIKDFLNKKIENEEQRKEYEAEMQDGLSSERFIIKNLNSQPELKSSPGNTDDMIDIYPPIGFYRTVTIENCNEYSQLLIKNRFDDIMFLTEAIFRGFRNLVPASRILPILSGKELEVIVCGVQDIDVDSLEKIIVYTGGVKQTDRHIQFFWQILRYEFNSEQRTQFIRFVSGRERLLGAGANDVIRIGPHSKSKADNAPDKYLPEAHTCFSSLDLPAYTKMEIMKDKLLLAIQCVAIDSDQTREGQENMAMELE